MNVIEIDVLNYAKRFPNWHMLCVYKVYLDNDKYYKAIDSLIEYGYIEIDKEKEKFKITEKGLNFQI